MSTATSGCPVLTKHEISIILQLETSKTLCEIADDIGIRHNNARRIVNMLRVVLGLRRRHELVAWAIANRSELKKRLPKAPDNRCAFRRKPS